MDAFLPTQLPADLLNLTGLYDRASRACDAWPCIMCVL